VLGEGLVFDLLLSNSSRPTRPIGSFHGGFLVTDILRGRGTIFAGVAVACSLTLSLLEHLSLAVLDQLLKFDVGWMRHHPYLSECWVLLNINDFLVPVAILQ